MRLFSFSVCCLICISGVAQNKSDADHQADLSRALQTDKAIYKVGETVLFSFKNELTQSLRIRYRHLDKILEDHALSRAQWKWNPPGINFTGYLVELYLRSGAKDSVVASIAVDVSDDWSHFPRYGFLSKYGQLSANMIDSVIGFLNRCHINGIQFYDWQSKHHQPLAGSVDAPSGQWKDIANRDTYLKTVRDYISAAHRYDIKCMFYNLIYGVLKDASPDSVSETWYDYTDDQHRVKEVFHLPDWFVSDIFLMDPSNSNWQNYLALQNRKVYQVFDFDGYHVDQLGDRDKALYNYNGQQIDMPSTFLPFMLAMKKFSPDKALTMNSVNNYGQAGLAKSPVNFLYTEVWPPNDTYNDLVNIIKENDQLSNGKKKTVLTAYMDYKLSDSAGNFNTAGILFTDAVTFAWGATHLELGEHMLGREYFPSDKLVMKEDLKRALIRYYDFQTAYENLLAENGTWNHPIVYSKQLKLKSWPSGMGEVAIVGKTQINRQIIHLINFSQANSMEWRDSKGTQKEPLEVYHSEISLLETRPVKKIWFATPDMNSGSPVDLPFRQVKGSVYFSLPYLKYWDMLVVEF